MQITNAQIVSVMQTFGFMYKMKNQKKMEMGINLSSDVKTDNTRIIIRKDTDADKFTFIFYPNDVEDRKDLVEWEEEMNEAKTEAQNNGESVVELKGVSSTDNGIEIGVVGFKKPKYNATEAGLAAFKADLKTAVADVDGYEVEE